MENRIDKLITLESGSKYYIVNQGTYLEKNYYFVVKVNEEETDFINEGYIVEEINDNPLQLKRVEDKELLQTLLKYLAFDIKEVK